MQTRVILNDPQNGSTVPSNIPINLTIIGTEGNYIFNWNNGDNQTVAISEYPMTPVKDGLHYLHVFAEDTLGNAIRHVYTYTIQNSPIVITLISPENNSILKIETEVIISFSETPIMVVYSWNSGNNETSLSSIPAVEGVYFLDVYAMNIHVRWSHTRFRWQVDLNDAPTIDLIYPTGGETVSGTITISWHGTDPDNDSLTYSVYISQNQGNSWIKLKSDLTREVYDWNTENYSNGQYLIKITASDGSTISEVILSTSITVQNLSTPPTLTTPGFELLFIIFSSVFLTLIGRRKMKSGSSLICCL